MKSVFFQHTTQMKMMHRIYTPFANMALTLLAVSLSLLSGCGSDSSSSGNGSLQMINTMEDSPTLFVEVEDSEDDLVETISVFGFQTASSLRSIVRGTYEISVKYIDPETEFEERLITTDVDIFRGNIHTGVLTGTFDDPNLLWFDKPEGIVTDPDSEDIEVQAINMSSRSLSLFLGDAAEGLSADALVATLAANEVSDARAVPHDDDADYRARATEDGSSDIIFDSGDINVPVASRRTLVATDPTGPDSNVVSVFVVTDAGSERYQNEQAASGFRLINGIADVADARMVVTTPATGDVLQDVTLLFGQASSFQVADGSFVDVDVFAPASETIATRSTVSLNEDEAYSITAAGSALNQDVSIRANVYDLRSVANSINLHFINTLQETDEEDSSDVDVYALQLGDALSDTAPLASRVGFLESTSVVLGATSYDLVVTTSGTQSILAGPQRIFPDSGEVRIALSAEAVGGGEPNQIITLLNNE